MNCRAMTPGQGLTLTKCDCGFEQASAMHPTWRLPAHNFPIEGTAVASHSL